MDPNFSFLLRKILTEMHAREMKNKIALKLLLSKIPQHLEEIVWIPVTAEVEISLGMNPPTIFALYEPTPHVTLFYTSTKNRFLGFAREQETELIPSFLLLLCFLNLEAIHARIYLAFLEGKMEPILDRFLQGRQT